MPCIELREAFVEYVEEFRRAGEPFQQSTRDQVIADFAGYLRDRRNMAAGIDLPPTLVPQQDYWLVCGGRIVATSRLRKRLTDALRIEGGHIGYEVRPGEQGKGWATRLLALTLEEARKLGIKRALVTCDRDNLASARVIRKNGGEFDSETVSPRTGHVVQRYWIDL